MATTLVGLVSLAAVFGVTGQKSLGGGFSNDNGDRSENVSVKTSSHFFKFSVSQIFQLT